MEIQACERDRARDAETLALRKEIQAMEQKVQSKAYAQTEETNTTLDPIAIVTRMLEQIKKADDTQEYIEMLRGDIAAGQDDRRTYSELSKVKDSNGRKILDFIKSALPNTTETQKKFLNGVKL